MKHQNKKHTKTRNYLKLIGTALLLSAALTYILYFIAAFLSPSKEVILSINSIGEANFEMFVALPLTLVFGFIAFFLTLKDCEDAA